MPPRRRGGRSAARANSGPTPRGSGVQTRSATARVPTPPRGSGVQTRSAAAAAAARSAAALAMRGITPRGLRASAAEFIPVSKPSGLRASAAVFTPRKSRKTPRFSPKNTYGLSNLFKTEQIKIANRLLQNRMRNMKNNYKSVYGQLHMNGKLNLTKTRPREMLRNKISRLNTTKNAENFLNDLHYMFYSKRNETPYKLSYNKYFNPARNVYRRYPFERTHVIHDKVRGRKHPILLKYNSTGRIVSNLPANDIFFRSNQMLKTRDQVRSLTNDNVRALSYALNKYLKNRRINTKNYVKTKPTQENTNRLMGHIHALFSGYKARHRIRNIAKSRRIGNVRTLPKGYKIGFINRRRN